MRRALAFALLAVLSAPVAAAPQNCAPGLMSAFAPTGCRIAIADNWYLTPGMAGNPGYRALTDNFPRVFKLQAGASATSGMRGNAAVYLDGNAGTPAGIALSTGRLPDGGSWDRSPERSFLWNGGLERSIPLNDWRGRRLQVTLRLRNGADVRAYVSVWMGKGNNTVLRTSSQVNNPQDRDWQLHQFVLDVPEDANRLVILAGLIGRGTAWLDDVRIEAVSADVPVSWRERIDNTPSVAEYPDPMVALGPGPIRRDGR